MQSRRIAAAAGVFLLALPAAVGAKGKPDHAGKKEGKGKSKPATYVFKGTWNDAASTVVVTGGNSRVRKQGLKGTEVAFDFTAARVKVADTNGDGLENADDFAQGDKLVVQAKLPRDISTATAPYAARKVVDQTAKGSEDDEDEAEETPEVPEETPVAPEESPGS